MIPSSRTLFTWSALVLSFGASLATARAQTATHNIVVTIPFDFNSGSVHLRAGKYNLQTDGQTNFLLLRGVHDGAQTLMQQDESKAPAESGRLVFHRYGSRYFLREVRFAGSSVFLKCSESKPEQLERIAAANAPSSLIQVAANPTSH